MINYPTVYIPFTRSLTRLRLLAGLVLAFGFQTSALAFEGRIRATITQGGQSSELLYTVGTNQLRIEMTDTTWPHAVNLVDRPTGGLTLLFPHNQSFVRVKPVDENAAPPFPGAPTPPPGIGSGLALPKPPAPPQMPGAPVGVGPTNLPGMPAAPPMPQMPAPPPALPPGIGPSPAGAAGMPRTPGMAPGMAPMPRMPMGMMERVELTATGEKTNLLGLACVRYELKQRGEVMEIWATDQLFSFQSYQQNQPHRFGPLRLEEQWPGLLQARRLFPLLVTLRFETGPERYRFAVSSIKPDKIADPDGKLFAPPAGYQEIEPLPF